jgi:hypothetical protein
MMIPLTPEEVSDYFKRYELNSILVDPVTNKMYNVCKRATTQYRSKKYKFLNVNRVPLDFSLTLMKGQPLVLYNEKETFLMAMYRVYPPAKKWQNITCMILNNALEFCEVLDKWETSLTLTQAPSTM